MIKCIKALILIACMQLLSACVTVEPEPPIMVNGLVGYLERIKLPQGSTITIALVDLKHPDRVIAQKNFNVAQVPVPFKFMLPQESIDTGADYSVVAMITYKGQLIFKTFDRFPVINNGVLTTEVWMKRVPVR